MAFEGTRTFITQQSAAPGTKETGNLSFEDAKYKFERFIKEWTSGKSFIYRFRLFWRLHICVFLTPNIVISCWLMRGKVITT